MSAWEWYAEAWQEKRRVEKILPDHLGDSLLYGLLKVGHRTGETREIPTDQAPPMFTGAKQWRAKG